jgi:hypothetical protein
MTLPRHYINFQDPRCFGRGEEHGEVSNRDMALIFVEEPPYRTVHTVRDERASENWPKELHQSISHMEGQLWSKAIAADVFWKR